MNTLSRSLVALGTAGLLALAACGGDDATDPTTTVAAAPATGGTDSTAPTGAGPLTITDAWVKAADDGMTAAFGVLHNSGDEPITVTGATSSVSPMMELHETVESATGEMTMREREGGFVIAPGADYALQPGADHLMMMGLEAPLTAGTDVEVTLTLDDGSTFAFTAPAKDYSGANEQYMPGE
jgi:copper(I)-binding protein